MNTHQFPSKESAISYMESKGTLKFYGKEIDQEGKQFDVYNWTTQGNLYHVFLYEDGKVKYEKGRTP